MKFLARQKINLSTPFLYQKKGLFIILFIHFFSLRSFSKELVEIENLVNVSSLYEFGNRVSGAGVLIEVTLEKVQRYFILTAAHLSQGQSLTIQIGHETVPLVHPNSRISDSRNDVELLEITKPPGRVPLVTIDSKLLTADDSDKPIFEINKNWFRDKIAFQTFKNSPHIFYLGGNYDPETKKNFEEPSFAVINTVPQLTLQNKRARAGIEPEAFDVIETSGYGNMLVVPSGLITPGMSGSPLIQPYRISEEVRWFLDGIALQYHRFGFSSYFLSSRHFLKIFRLYLLESRRGPLNDWVWKSQQGQLYREFCYFSENQCRKSEEIIAHERPAGGGVRGDGGGDSEEKNSTANIISSAHPSQISAPIRIEGRDIHGFEVENRKTGNRFYIEANLAAFDFMDQNRNQYSFKEVGSRFSAVSLLLAHYRNQIPDNTEFPIHFRYKYHPNTWLTLYKDHIELGLQATRLPSTRTGKSFDRELLVLQLNTSGGLLLRSGEIRPYQPIVEVRGPHSGINYWVDLRQLFFLDLTHVPKNDTVFSKIYRIEPQGLEGAEFVEKVFQIGGTVGFRAEKDAMTYGVTAFLYPKKGLLNPLLEPILDWLAPIPIKE